MKFDREIHQTRFANRKTSKVEPRMLIGNRILKVRCIAG